MTVLSDQVLRDVPAPTGMLPSTGRRGSRLRLSPWRHAWFLEGFTWLYLLWMIVPIVVAVIFSFNSGKSTSAWRGFSTQWWSGNPNTAVFSNPEMQHAIYQSLVLAGLTTLITVPIGVAFAIGIDRWKTRTAGSLNFVMIFSFVVPELLLAVALFFVVTQLFHFIPLGTTAEVAGLVVFNISWPALVVRARLITIGKTYEEAAADLGASRVQALTRVLARMLVPAIFASAILVFAGVIDDFVIVEQLSSTANTQPMSVLIYSNVHGGIAGPALNALATIMLGLSFVVALVGFVVYRFLTRGERGSKGTAEALTSIAGM